MGLMPVCLQIGKPHKGIEKITRLHWEDYTNFRMLPWKRGDEKMTRIEKITRWMGCTQNGKRGVEVKRLLYIMSTENNLA